MGYPFSWSFSRTNAVLQHFCTRHIWWNGLALYEIGRNGAVSGNSTKDYSNTSRSRRHEQSIPPPMKNERHMPNEIFWNANDTSPNTKHPNDISKWGWTVCTWIQLPIFLSTAAAVMPRRSGFPKGSGEVLERDRGSKSPVSFQPPPRGVNKIYTYDVVFHIGEANT